ncbi:MAG: phosphoribosylglycinamide formyltransferase [Hydrogenophilales bacterium]
MKKNIILISGRGSNLQAILENIDKKSIIAVMTDNPNAKGLLIAKKYGIETCVVAKTSDKQKFKDDLYKKILFYSPDLLILAGFMSILSEKIVNAFYPNILNIHPSLLPKFAGLNTHSRVLEANEINHGCTVHIVDNGIDTGPIITQRALLIEKSDTPESLEKRVLALEHTIYPKVIKWFLKNDPIIKNNVVINFKQ